MLKKIATFGIGIVALCLAAQAQNGKNPPNVNPTHYQCYKVEAANNSGALRELHDQFGVSQGVKFGPAVMLCAPTGKNGEAVKDLTTHYLCYEDEGVKTPNKKVRVINQLTEQAGIETLVLSPTMLCVPSLKEPL